jgi:putative aldouronate transport system substrate-binding protein
MKKVISLVLCLLIVLTFVVSSFAFTTVKITGVKVDKTNLTLDVGASYGLVITLSPANTTQKNLTFTTSDANIATVDGKGTITGVKPGKAVITVTSSSNNKLTAKCNVTVKEKEPVTLTVEVYDRGTTGQTPPDNNYWTDWIQKNYGDKNNVKLKFVTCPRFDNEAKIQIWMASGTAPDVSITYDINICYNFYKNGGLTDLTTILDQYGPELKSFLGKDVLAKGQYKQKQYVIPARRVIEARAATWIRKDWLDKLNLGIPTTTEEFYNVLKQFKDKNPGKVAKVVPYVLTQDVGWIAAPLLESFKTDKTEMNRYLTRDRFMQLYADGYKEGVRFLNKLYNENLVSKEFPLDKDGKMGDADIINGYAGSMSSNYDQPLRAVPGHIDGLLKNVKSAELIPIDPFKDKDGLTTKPLYDPAGIRIFVPKTSSAKAAEAVKYLNWMCDKDVLFFLQYGEEGVGHIMQNGFPVAQTVTGEKTFNSPNNIDYTLIVNGVMMGDREQTIKLNSLAYDAKKAELWIQAYKLSTVNGYVEPSISTPLDAEAKYANALQVKGYEVYAKTITCKPADFDKVWDQMMNEYSRAGGSAVITARRQGWIDDRG